MARVDSRHHRRSRTVPGHGPFALRQSSRAEVRGWIRDFAAQHPWFRFLDTEGCFLKGDPVRLYDRATTLYHDDDHVSVEGAMRVTNAFRHVLIEAAQAGTATEHKP